VITCFEESKSLVDAKAGVAAVSRIGSG